MLSFEWVARVKTNVSLNDQPEGGCIKGGVENDKTIGIQNK